MIVDRRAGSRDLFPQLQMAKVRPLELGDLHYGDVSILGNGPEGCPWTIGIEYKKLPDLIQSIDNGRLAGHQLPGMLECYQSCWLLIEGIWQTGRFGEVVVPRNSGWKSIINGRAQGFSAKSLYGFILTCQIKLGIQVVQCGTSDQTVSWLSAMNRWWTEKEYEEHRAHLAFDNSSALTLVSRPSLVRRVAKELPGIGWGRSGAVAKRFTSVAEMATASQADWQGIEGIGKTTAEKVVRAIDGEEGK